MTTPPVTAPPKWFRPVAVLALIWNLLGCLAYLSDVTMSPEDVARLTAAQQALYETRPVWAVAATAVAVWAGALGSLGLVLRKRWATPLLVASLLGIVLQDIALFGVAGGAAAAGGTAMGLQALVLLAGIGLVMLARRAAARGWIT